MRRALRVMLLAVTALLLGVTTTILSPLPAWASVYRLCYGYSNCADAGYGNAGYAQNNGTMYWRMYSGHNCTNYAAYRMVRSGMPNTRPWDGGGNATYWGSYMIDITDQTPTVGAVAWWRAGVYPAGSAGHVAYVEKVISPTEIIVSQDSWGGDFSWARITKSGSGWPSGFVHFNDVSLRNVTRPEVTGNPKVGATLSATPGTWSPGTADVSYQWVAEGEDLPGETRPKITLTDDLVGKRLRVRVTAEADGYPSAAKQSVYTDRVLPGVLAATAEPTVTGDARVGETLVGDAGDWAPDPDEVRFEWRVDGARVDGATTSTYTVTPQDVGKRVFLRVVARRDGYTKVVFKTPAQEVRPGTLRASGTPEVTGDMVPGETLRTTVPTASPDASRTLQWLRDGEPIADATRRTYELTDQDLGHRVRARVTFTKDGYTTLTTSSAVPQRVRTTPHLRAQLDQVRGKVLVAVQVTAPGVDRIGSVIRVRDERGRLLAEKPLRDDGTATLRLTDQALGKHTYRIVSRTTHTTSRAFVDKTIAVR